MNHTTDPTAAVYDALVEFQKTAGWPQLALAQIRQHLAEHIVAALPAPVSPPADRGAKAEALLLHFAAEAHRRKWSYDRGLDDDGVPIKSEAFDALHRLGEDMRKELEALRRMAAGEQQPEAAREIVHGCPPDGSGLTPCCGRTPFELPLGDRISSEAPITCPTADGPRRVAAEEQPAETQDDGRAKAIAELLPAWEAVYEPGNVSDYLIGYANDQDPATGMAEAWMRSQAEVTGRLEWTPWGDATPMPDGYDAWFELVERHDDGIDTGPGIIVRRRIEPVVGEQSDTQEARRGC